MTPVEILTLIVTFVGVISFASVFTILYYSYAKSSINELHSGKRDIELIDDILYEKIQNKKISRKVWRIVRSVFFYLILIIIIPIIIISLINKIQGTTTMITNHSIMVVASGSMSEKNKANDYLIYNNLNNQFLKNDVIILSKVKDVNELKVYDVIAFNDPTKHETVIHRIIAIHHENGKVTFTTRGDANAASDTFNPSMDDVVGKYINKRIPTIGIFVLFIQSPSGILTILAMIYCLVMIDRISYKISKVSDERVAHLSEIISQIDEDNVEALNATYKETIYYKGFAYHFDDKGFVSKDEIDDDEVLKKTSDTIIKVVENDDLSKQVNEIVVNDDKKGE